MPENIEVELVSDDILKESSKNVKYDYIVSGLPFNNFEPRVVEAILASYMKMLKAGGVLSFFEYAYVRDIKLGLYPSKSSEYGRIHQIDEIIRYYSNKFSGEKKMVFRNIPPAFVNFMVR